MASSVKCRVGELGQAVDVPHQKQVTLAMPLSFRILQPRQTPTLTNKPMIKYETELCDAQTPNRVRPLIVRKCELREQDMLAPSNRGI